MIHEDQGAYMAEAIKNGTAIAVSDGSHKDSRSTAACVIEGKIPFHKRIIATATSPGPAHIQDAYRGKLTGLYMIALIIHRICQVYKITQGTITVGCDGYEALKKGFDENTYSSCRSSQFDLISAINNLLELSPLQWKWRHVPGHQDDHYGPLDRWSTLNVKMDGRAKARRRKDSIDNPKIQYEIAYESWRLYTGMPNLTSGVLPSAHKVCHNLDEELDDLVEGRKIIKYWTDHYIIQPEAQDNIDWIAIKKAREKTNFHKRKWATKWAAEVLPIGTVMQDRGNWEEALCPRNCGKEMETCEHVFICSKATPLWQEIQNILSEWALAAEARPGLMASILEGLHQWRNGDKHELTVTSDPLLTAAFKEQETIGWEALLKGFLSSKWQEAQKLHFAAIKSRKSGLRFIAALIRKLFDVSWDFWNHRNHYLYREDSQVMEQLNKQLDTLVKLEYHKGPTDLPKRNLYLFHMSLPQIIRKPLRTKLAWVEAITAARGRIAATSKKGKQDPNKAQRLIEKYRAGGFLQKLKVQKAKPPKLRTTSKYKYKSWLVVERDITFDDYEMEQATMHEYVEDDGGD